MADWYEEYLSRRTAKYRYSPGALSVVISDERRFCAEMRSVQESQGCSEREAFETVCNAWLEPKNIYDAYRLAHLDLFAEDNNGASSSDDDDDS